MARQSTNHHLYIGRAGHLATMSECLSRGWNVAIPEVDVGEDIFVVEDATSKMAKVQVKTATGKKITNGFKAQFIIPKKQLTGINPKDSELRYVFVTRYKANWQPFIIMTRKELEDKHSIEHIGTISKNEKDIILTIYYSYDENNKVIKIECGSQKGYSGKGIPKPELTSFMNMWEKFYPARITEGN
jgi:hypothetical protein